MIRFQLLQAFCALVEHSHLGTFGHEPIHKSAPKSSRTTRYQYHFTCQSHVLSSAYND